MSLLFHARLHASLILTSEMAPPAGVEPANLRFRKSLRVCADRRRRDGLGRKSLIRAPSICADTQCIGADSRRVVRKPGAAS